MVDVLRPELVWIEGRCYRLNEPILEAKPLEEHNLYEAEMYGDKDDGDFDENEDYEIVALTNSRYSTSFHVPQHYLGYIIGKKGATRNRIERDTKTTIKIPRQGQSGSVEILGSSIASVRTARRRVDMVVNSSKIKQKPTHFVSVPVSSQQIMDNFKIFKDQILKEFPDSGVEESLFISSCKLHITAGVMCLMDNEERLCASKLLTEARDKIIRPLLKEHLPLKLRVKGISYMNDDPSQVHVLYALVWEENAPAGILQEILNAIVNHFTKAGHMFEERSKSNVKIHVTLMNSRYRDAEDLESEGQRVKRISFDATRIMEKFSDYDFGVCELTEIHISLMPLSSTRKRTLDAYYESTCVVTV